MSFTNSVIILAMSCLIFFAPLNVQAQAPDEQAEEQTDELSDFLSDEDTGTDITEEDQQNENIDSENETQERDDNERYLKDEDQEYEEAEQEDTTGDETPARNARSNARRRAVNSTETNEAPVSYDIKINGTVNMAYTFIEEKNTFNVKYQWEIKAVANTATASINGEVTITPEVEGAIAKWPGCECNLEIDIPKTPFQLGFRKDDEDKGSIKLTFKRPILETWRSKCTFAGKAGVEFNTSGPPEKWLMSAIEKARPSLKDLVAELSEQETQTGFTISKTTINDDPIGSADIEGLGIVTITPIVEQ